MNIDHVTVAGSDLAAFERVFTDLEMTPRYGGPHSNGITHMSLLPFPNDSYMELMSTMRRGEQCPLWSDYLLGECGGTAWTVEVDDVAAEVDRVRAAGIKGTGPELISRVRPDGTVGRWELGYLGDGQPGGTLPFVVFPGGKMFPRKEMQLAGSTGWCLVYNQPCSGTQNGNPG